MTVVEWSEAALDDLRAINAYLRPRSRQGAATLARRIEAAEVNIATFPRASRRDCASGTYEYVIRGMPYLLIYAMQSSESIEGDQRAVIPAVFHTSRDPATKPGTSDLE
jgi:toxin ParE1/3/4